MKQRLYDFQRRPYVKDWEFRNCREHDELIDAIKAGDASGAARLMREVHWSFEVQEAYIREFYRREALERLQAQQAQACG
jgi:DNA-binding GntR family transcriptional regulator